MIASRRRTAVSLALILLVAAVWWWRRGADPSGDVPAAQRGEDPSLLVDRLWVDSKPEKYTDYTHVFIAITAAPFGIFQKSSAYQATSELFEYKRRENRISMHFPQTGTQRQVTYQIRRCDDLSPFDLCLDLSDNPWGGPRRYYGMADPEDEATHLGDLRNEVEHRIPRE